MKAYIFVETGDLKAKAGERWYSDAEGNLHQICADWDMSQDAHKVPLFRRIEIDVPTFVAEWMDGQNCNYDGIYEDGFRDAVNWLEHKLGLTID
jgi:hypothetical protein